MPADASCPSGQPVRAAAADRFAGALGGRRGTGPEHAGRIIGDEDVVRAWLRGETDTQSGRLQVLNHPDGPDPSAFFIVDREHYTGVGCTRGILAARWVDEDGTLNISCSPSFPDELYGPVSARTRAAGCRPLLTTSFQLGIDQQFAAGLREDLHKVDRDAEHKRKQSARQAERDAAERGEPAVRNKRRTPTTG